MTVATRGYTAGSSGYLTGDRYGTSTSGPYGGDRFSNDFVSGQSRLDNLYGSGPQVGQNYTGGRTTYGGGGSAQGGGGDPRYGGYTGGGGSGGQSRIEDSRRTILDLTQGRGDELRNDPYTMAALDRMRAFTEGRDAPFTQSTIDGLYSRQSDMNASAEQAQNNALRDGYMASGGSIRDPAVQAAMRESMAQRQGANANARRDIGVTANLENANFRMQGANSLAAGRGAQNSLINQMYGQAVNFLSNDNYSRNIAGGLAAGGQNTPIAQERSGGSPRVGGGGGLFYTQQADPRTSRTGTSTVRSGDGITYVPNQDSYGYLGGF